MEADITLMELLEGLHDPRTPGVSDTPCRLFAFGFLFCIVSRRSSI